MKLKIYSRETVEKEVDVTFPIYREHDTTGEHESIVHYMRVIRNADTGRMVETDIRLAGNHEAQILHQLQLHVRQQRSGLPARSKGVQLKS